MAVRISRDLNLVFPVDTDDGAVYVHSTPVSREVFERYYRVICKTFAEIYQEGLAAISGPRAAALMLKEVAENTRGRDGQPNAWVGPDGVENGFMNEVRRLTNVVMPVGPLSPVVSPDDTESPPVLAPGGWQTVPLYDVIRQKLLLPEDIAEVEGVVCFFIVCSASHRRADLPAFLDLMAGLWGASITSYNVTAFKDSLPTSIGTVSSGVRAVA